MKHPTPPFPLNPRSALICLLMLTSPLALGETGQNIDPTEDKPVVSKKAVRRLYTAFDWLLLISRDKWATNNHNHRNFKFKLNLIQFC